MTARLTPIEDNVLSLFDRLGSHGASQLSTLWAELQRPVRISLIVSSVGAIFLFGVFLALAGEAGSILSSGSDPITGAVLILSPMIGGLLTSGVLLLLFRRMSQENRGILGFFLFIVAIIPVIALAAIAFNLLLYGEPVRSGTISLTLSGSLGKDSSTLNAGVRKID